MFKKIIKYLKIIIINSLILLLILILFEGFLYYCQIQDWKKAKMAVPKYQFIKKDFTLKKVSREFNIPVGLEYKKPPILIYGCSFGYGLYLKQKSTPHCLFSKLTKRPVYNFSLIGRGLQHALYIIKNQELISPAPEYVIYVLYSDQIRRLYTTCDTLDKENFLEYKIKNGKVVFEDKKSLNKILKNTILYRTIKANSYIKYLNPNIIYENNFKFMIKEIKNAIKEKYPNAKFILVLYDTPEIFPKEKINELKKSEIYTIDLFDIFGDKHLKDEYIIKDDGHPNEKAWEMIISEIIKREKM